MRTNATDELFVHAKPGLVYAAMLERGLPWWPGASVRSEEGRVSVRAPGFRRLARPVRFSARVDGIRPSEGLTWWIDRGEVRGRGEWWFEPFKDGTIVHYYLDVEPGDRGRARRWPSRVRRHRWAVRRGVNALKDSLEGRAAVAAPERRG